VVPLKGLSDVFAGLLGISGEQKHLLTDRQSIWQVCVVMVCLGGVAVDINWCHNPWVEVI